MDIPIPFALSLVKMQLKKAIATKMTESNIPAANMMRAVPQSANINNGMPTPIRYAVTKLSDSPMNKAFHIILRFTGWLTNNSINSLLL